MCTNSWSSACDDTGSVTSTDAGICARRKACTDSGKYCTGTTIFKAFVDLFNTAASSSGFDPNLRGSFENCEKLLANIPGSLGTGFIQKGFTADGSEVRRVQVGDIIQEFGGGLIRTDLSYARMYSCRPRGRVVASTTGARRLLAEVDIDDMESPIYAIVYNQQLRLTTCASQGFSSFGELLQGNCKKESDCAAPALVVNITMKDSDKVTIDGVTTFPDGSRWGDATYYSCWQQQCFMQNPKCKGFQSPIVGTSALESTVKGDAGSNSIDFCDPRSTQCPKPNVSAANGMQACSLVAVLGIATMYVLLVL